jgi:hypothetical protein
MASSNLVIGQNQVGVTGTIGRVFIETTPIMSTGTWNGTSIQVQGNLSLFVDAGLRMRLRIDQAGGLNPGQWNYFETTLTGDWIDVA